MLTHNACEELSACRRRKEWLYDTPEPGCPRVTVLQPAVGYLPWNAKATSRKRAIRNEAASLNGKLTAGKTKQRAMQDKRPQLWWRSHIRSGVAFSDVQELRSGRFEELHYHWKEWVHVPWDVVPRQPVTQNLMTDVIRIPRSLLIRTSRQPVKQESHDSLWFCS